MQRPTIAHAPTGWCNEQLLVGYRAIIGRLPSNYWSLPSNYWSVTDQLLISLWAIIPHHAIPTIGHTYDLVGIIFWVQA
jgi:hypothetical protein